MATAKTAITLEENILRQLDLLVKSHIFPNRGKAIQEAVKDKSGKIEQNRLETECLKLTKEFEQSLADEGLSAEIEEWPNY